MPKVTPGPGESVEETTVTRIVPNSKTETEKSSTDALEYMDGMTREKWDQGNHIVYVYRVEPVLYRGTSGPTYVTKYVTPVTLDQIQQEYGGGLWRFVIKRGSERVSDSRYQLSGTPRDLTRTIQEFNPALPGGVPPSEQGGVVSQAMSIVADPTARSAQVAMLTSAATAAVDLVKANASQQLTVKDIFELADKMRGPVTQEKPFLETPLGAVLVAAATALINRLLTPVDPLDQLIKMGELAKTFGGGSSTSDWKAALVNAAPQLANAVKDTMHELRLGTEAQMQINAGRTLTAAPPPPPPAPNLGATAPNPSAQNVVEMPAPQVQQTGAQPMEPFEQKLVELLNDPTMTGDKAGEILDAQWPRFIDEIAQYSVDQILVAFNTRPILAPHAKNPRLRQFLTEFLQWANETDNAPLTPPAPAS